MKSLADLSSAEIAKAVRLAKKKEALLKELSAIESELAALGEGKSAAPRRGRPPKKAGAKPGPKPGRKAAAAKKAAPAKKSAATDSSRKRGALKTKILSALKSAGSEGVAVKDLASKLKVKSTNVYSWFYTTGTKIPGIKKVGPGRYAMTS